MILFGAVLAAVGAVFYVLGRLGIGRLGGDLSFGGRNWRVYIPIGTCILLSIIVTLAIWLLCRARR